MKDMLISDKYNFIFIHIYKNAGSSITNALIPFVGNGAQRFANKVLLRFDNWVNVNKFHKFLAPRPYAHHIKAKELVDEIGFETFNKYFSFAIVRNPWDWQVSLYKYMLKEPMHFQHKLIKSLGSFEKYIEWRCKKEVRLQKNFVCSADGKLLVDYIGRYENLDYDFKKICKRIGIETNLQKLNISNTRAYQKYYNKKTIEMVRGAFAADIDYFDYSFE